ncbi:MAG TPA: SURF1 family protein [Nocardioides sp.]
MTSPTSRSLLTGRVVAGTLLAVVLVGIAGWLGGWQLDAWQARRAAEARDLTRLDPVPLSDVMGPDAPFPGNDVGRPVDVTGTWLPDGTFFVSGREDDGVAGYWVVTPVRVEDSAVLVVRGWSPTPQAPPVTGRTEVTGWLQPPDGATGLVDDDPADDVVPQLQVADALQRVDTDLYGAYVVGQQPTAGLEAAELEALPEVGRFTALRNLLYALEWWFFGAFAAFVWWRWVRDEQAVTAATDAEAVAGGGAGEDGAGR